MTPTIDPVVPALDLYEFSQQYTEDGWLKSDWLAGQSRILQWSPDNVRLASDGSVELVLERAVESSDRPFQAGEIQSVKTATTGTWSWTVQSPNMVPGAVFGMFTFQAEWGKQPWIEFDFEFVGADTTRVQLNIHMENSSGERVTLDNDGRNLVIVDLGFDAAEDVHKYEVTVMEEKAVFYIDGKIVGEFSGADMPGGTWNIGPMKGHVNLWAVQPEQEIWAGAWTDPGKPLIARVVAADVRAGELDSSYAAAPEAFLAEPTVQNSVPIEVVDPDGTITAVSDRSYRLPEHVTNLLLTGTGHASGTGNALANRLTGNTGDNILDGGLGADVLQGGAGNDTYIIDKASDRIVEGANAGVDTVRASISSALKPHVENLILQGRADLNGTGNALANRLTRNTGDNILDGGLGADVLQGGAGNDTYIIDKASDRIVEGANAGVDTVRASMSSALKPHVENLILQGRADLNGTGNALANRLTGNTGDNILGGGLGADVLQGGAGNDTYIIDKASDRIVEGANAGVDTVRALISSALKPHVENLILQGPADLNGTGNALANRLTGNTGDNILDGGLGADILQGGAGNDTYIIDKASDRIVEGANAGVDTVRASISFALTNHVEDLVLRGTLPLNGTGNAVRNRLIGNPGNNRLDGGIGSDSLEGRAGHDTLLGGHGADRLLGGLGKDLMTGGLSADTFVFRTLGDSRLSIAQRDVIADFNRNHGDKIDLSAIDATPYFYGDQAFRFISMAGFSGVEGELRYEHRNGMTLILIDATGDRAADFSVGLTTALSLMADDFLL